MSPKGNCFDNVMIESFFDKLKAEYLRLALPTNVEVLEAGMHDYICYYNYEYIKLGLRGLNPVQYRLRTPPVLWYRNRPIPGDQFNPRAIHNKNISRSVRIL